MKSEDATPQKEYNWHAKTAVAVLDELGTSSEGLSLSEVERRRATHGSNAFTEGKRTTLLQQLYNQFKSPLVIVLLLSALVTLGLEEYVDAIVITFALAIALVVGLVQEGRASRAFDRLNRSQVHTAIVVRRGERHEILATELVPGDIVILQTGAQVPADLRLTESKKLSVNEAALTGEWLAVKKQTKEVEVGIAFAERTSMAWKGTFVSEGYGVGVVVATGDNTEVGKIAEELGEQSEEQTPLQWQMARVSRMMFIVIVCLVLVIFLIGILRGEALETMLITAIAIAVASIPEGLPAAVTIVLAVGMESLLKRGGLVRNLLAAETLGSTTYVLTDKTGTLTEGRMALTDVVHWGEEGLRDASELGSNASESVREVLNMALCASDAFVERKTDEKEGEESYVVRGEPMERAILEAGLTIFLEGESTRSKRIDYLSFTSENRIAAGLCTRASGNQLCVNGVPEYLLEVATNVHTADGVAEMRAEDRKNFTDAIDRLTKEGKRIIAVGYRNVDMKALPEDPEDIMREGLVFAGILVFHDPVRSDVKDAITGVMHAGAQVRLVTGDNPQTALSIAREVGIAREHDVALTGKDITALTDDELYEVMQTTRVFARILPRQKLRLAQVLQKRGEIVAMTGDGVNDAPALQKANIGVALGSGTEVAKEASDLVLVNDTFATIYAAIEEGRRIIGNLRKIVGYLLTTSLSEALLIGTALLIGMPIPIVPVQILWANIIEEGFMSVAFAFESGDKRAMQERPHDIHAEGILSKQMLLFIGLATGVMSALLLLIYGYLVYIDMPIDQLRSMMFVVVSIDSLFLAFSFRSLSTPVWKISFLSNKFFLMSFLASLLMLVLAITVPPLERLLSYEPLPLSYLGLAFVYGFISMMVIEVGKWIFFERKT